MYNDYDIEELREQQRRRSNMKFIKPAPCRGYDFDYNEDEDDDDIDRYAR